MLMEFYASVKFEGSEGFFWSLWKTEGLPLATSVPWDCGFALSVKAAMRAVRAADTVGTNRVTLLHPRLAHAACKRHYPNAADPRRRVLAQDEVFLSLRLAQLRGDAARARRKAASARSRAGAPSGGARRQSECRPPTPRQPAWSTVLGVSVPCTAADLKSAYRALAKKVHPDVGGSDAEFIRVKAVYDAGRRDLGVT